jgi:hypothetical protein
MMIVLVIIAFLLAIIVFGESIFLLLGLAFYACLFFAAAFLGVILLSGISEELGESGWSIIATSLVVAFGFYKYARLMEDAGSIKLFIKRFQARMLPETTMTQLLIKTDTIKIIDLEIREYKITKKNKRDQKQKQAIDQRNNEFEKKLKKLVLDFDSNQHSGFSILCDENIITVYAYSLEVMKIHFYGKRSVVSAANGSNVSKHYNCENIEETVQKSYLMYKITIQANKSLFK